MSKQRSITLLIQQPPYAGSSAKAALDMALSAAVFEQRVQMIFSADGVFQLLANQSPGDILAKNISAGYSALSLYGIDTVFVDQSALQQRGLDSSALCCAASLIDQNTIARMIHESDVVMTL
jgi:tRNA 2-thiouridine synthesizing protein C